MIPGAFSYHRPNSVMDAIGLLAELGEEARPLAGGHSLIPLMKLRLATPDHLIDLSGIAELKGIASKGGRIEIGAMVTQAALIASPLLAQWVPILRETALQIADPQIRSLGTIGGNVANGDPGNDMPAVMMSLGARYRLIGTAGEREVAARDFYQAAYFTALQPGEMLHSVLIPHPDKGHGYAYEKLKRKVGDYATAAAAVILSMAGGTVRDCAIGLTNVGDTPLLATEAARVLIGSALEPAIVAKAVAAAEAITKPASDGRGPADYRTKMAGMMVKRALAKAAARAMGEAGHA